MRVLIILAVCAAVALGQSERIVGGSLTTISQYPQMVSLLLSSDLQQYWQNCAGTILNELSILTAAHCTYQWRAVNWRARIGSTFANSGGTVYAIGTINNHPSFNTNTWNNDVAIIRTTARITFVNNAVQRATIAGSTYVVPDNQIVWAAGWGATSFGGPTSEQLRHVQIFAINQATCRSNYASNGQTVTENMLCAGYLGVGGRDQCSQDSGGPLYHNGIVVGIASWGYECGHPWLPGVNTRVSRYTTWIQRIANS